MANVDLNNNSVPLSREQMEIMERRRQNRLRWIAQAAAARPQIQRRSAVLEAQVTTVSWVFFRVWSPTFLSSIEEHRELGNKIHTKLSLIQLLSNKLNDNVRKQHFHLQKDFIVVNVETVMNVGTEKVHIGAKVPRLIETLDLGRVEKEWSITVDGDLAQVFKKLVEPGDLLIISGGRKDASAGNRLLLNSGFGCEAKVLHFKEGTQIWPKNSMGLPYLPFPNEVLNMQFCHSNSDKMSGYVQITKPTPRRDPSPALVGILGGGGFFPEPSQSSLNQTNPTAISTRPPLRTEYISDSEPTETDSDIEEPEEPSVSSAEMRIEENQEEEMEVVKVVQTNVLESQVLNTSSQSDDDNAPQEEEEMEVVKVVQGNVLESQVLNTSSQSDENNKPQEEEMEIHGNVLESQILNMSSQSGDDNTPEEEQVEVVKGVQGNVPESQVFFMSSESDEDNTPQEEEEIEVGKVVQGNVLQTQVLNMPSDSDEDNTPEEESSRKSLSLPVSPSIPEEKERPSSPQESQVSISMSELISQEFGGCPGKLTRVIKSEPVEEVIPAEVKSLNEIEGEGRFHLFCTIVDRFSGNENEENVGYLVVEDGTIPSIDIENPEDHRDAIEHSDNNLCLIKVSNYSSILRIADPGTHVLLDSVQVKRNNGGNLVLIIDGSNPISRCAVRGQLNPEVECTSTQVVPRRKLTDLKVPEVDSSLSVESRLRSRSNSELSNYRKRKLRSNSNGDILEEENSELDIILPVRNRGRAKSSSVSSNNSRSGLRSAKKLSNPNSSEPKGSSQCTSSKSTSSTSGKEEELKLKFGIVKDVFIKLKKLKLESV